jgi:transcription elongation factor Elf1
MDRPYRETAYDRHWNSKGPYGEERVRRKKIRKEKRIRKMFICPQCNHYRGYVIETKLNPYYKEMDGTEIYEKICDDCYNAAQGDI